MVVCGSCGHQNVNDNASFCGGCGSPLHTAPVPPEMLPATAEPSSPSIAHPAAGKLQDARKSSKRIVGIVAVLVCLAVVAGGLVLLHRSGLLTRAISSPRTNAAPAPSGVSTGAASPAAGAPISTPGSPSPSQTPATATTSIAQVAASTVIPPGTNIAAFDYGGEIETVSGAYGGPGLQGEALIDGTAQASWQPDAIVSVPADLQDNWAYPQEIVFSFYKRDTAVVSAVVLENVPGSPGPDAVEVWTSKDNSPTNFQPVAAAHLAPTATVQTIGFATVEARYVKVRIVSGPPDNLKLRQILIIEGSKPAYSSLVARHPDILTWKRTVRHAAQRGIDWLEPAAMDWQEHQRCFGCHVQAQTLMGLAIAQTNNYVVSASTLRDLAAFTCKKQDDDGHEKDEGADNKLTPTQFAAMGMAYFDEANGIKNDSTLQRYVDWMTSRFAPTGAFPSDFEEPPIAQGTINSTANAVAGFMEAYVQTGDPKYKTAGERGLAFIASEKPKTTQDKVFKVIALSRFGTPAQRELAARLVQQLKAEQKADGGWSETSSDHKSGAFATGQVLYAFKEAGVSTDSAEFNKGVSYLIKTQDPTGSWSPKQNGRPSKFAPTMWAVIGLAGNFEVPSADSLKADLDKYGRVVLYINFDFNKASVRPDGKPIIAQVLKLMQDNPGLKLAINGHTDNVGTRTYNLELSEKRAAAVVDALVAAGISRSRLSSGGFGPDQPIAENDTEKGRAKNRRVELVKM
jgi:outer membrane protein OmpA-like peptidoglycan-associated protein